eukprot:6304963-Amphidinium_carterae.1
MDRNAPAGKGRSDQEVAGKVCLHSVVMTCGGSEAHVSGLPLDRRCTQYSLALGCDLVIAGKQFVPFDVLDVASANHMDEFIDEATGRFVDTPDLGTKWHCTPC